MAHRSYDGINLDVDINTPNGNVIGQSSVIGELHTGNTDEAVSFQCRFKNPGAYTLSFNLDVPDASVAQNISVRAEALIEWKVAGNTITRRVTIGNGVSISGLAEACRVVIKDTTDLNGGGFPANLGNVYLVSAQIAKGTRATTATPPTLLPNPSGSAAQESLAAAGGTVIIPVIQDAGISSVEVVISSGLATPILEQNVRVQHRVSNGGIILKSYDPRALGFIPVAPGTEEIFIQNFDPLSTVFAQITFGIDG